MVSPPCRNDRIGALSTGRLRSGCSGIGMFDMRARQMAATPGDMAGNATSFNRRLTASQRRARLAGSRRARLWLAVKRDHLATSGTTIGPVARFAYHSSLAQTYLIEVDCIGGAAAWAE